MQYQQQAQPYGQVSGAQGGYYPPQAVSQQYPPGQQYPPQYPAQQYPQQVYLDPNVPVGQPVMGQPVGQPVYASQPMQPYGQGYNQQPYITSQPQPPIVSQCYVSSANGLRFPTEIQCPYCNKRGVTVVHHRVGDGTICASILVLLLCWPLFWLPCVLDDCKDRVHQCPNCMQVVGRKNYDLC